jgi:hypothetical protein
MAFGTGDADSESVVIGRTGTGIPEFLHVLRRQTKLMVLSMQKLQGGSGGAQNGLSR